jgi:pyridine nucleotide-disulfide oxidoreductase/AIPR protein
VERFDVIVIGMGPGGEAAAGRLQDAGRRVAVIERELIGGECAYWACIPSKTLLRGPEARAAAGRAAGVSTPALDWPGLRDYRDYMIRHLDNAAQPLPCLAAPATGKNLAVFFAIMPGATLAGLYGQYGTRLLELNVRSFLQTKGAVNRGIRDTLLTGRELFLATTTASPRRLRTSSSARCLTAAVRPLLRFTMPTSGTKPRISAMTSGY